MRFSVLSSGSRGNSIAVEHDDGTITLVDAGLSLIKTEAALRFVGLSRRNVRRIKLTHGHGDHARTADILRQSWGISAGDRYDEVSQSIVGFPVPHDDATALGYRVGMHLGIIGDAGCITEQMYAMTCLSRTLVIGCNYDDALIDACREHDESLHRRIKSNTGHLSNRQVAEFLVRPFPRLRRVVLIHLSEKHNSPARAFDAVRCVLGANVDLVISEYGKPTPLFEV